MVCGVCTCVLKHLGMRVRRAQAGFLTTLQVSFGLVGKSLLPTPRGSPPHPSHEVCTPAALGNSLGTMPSPYFPSDGKHKDEEGECGGKGGTKSLYCSSFPSLRHKSLESRLLPQPTLESHLPWSSGVSERPVCPELGGCSSQFTSSMLNGQKAQKTTEHVNGVTKTSFNDQTSRERRFKYFAHALTGLG